MKAIVAGVLVALSVTAARAASSDYSANNMLVYCKALIGDLQAENVVACLYCKGMLDTILFMSGILRDYPPVCFEMPSSFTIEQAARIVVRYIEAHPKKMDEALQSLAIEALHNAWPCKR